MESKINRRKKAVQAYIDIIGGCIEKLRKVEMPSDSESFKQEMSRVLRTISMTVNDHDNYQGSSTNSLDWIMENLEYYDDMDAGKKMMDEAKNNPTGQSGKTDVSEDNDPDERSMMLLWHDGMPAFEISSENPSLMFNDKRDREVEECFGRYCIFSCPEEDEDSKKRLIARAIDDLDNEKNEIDRKIRRLKRLN